MTHEQRISGGALVIGALVIGAFLYAKSRDGAAPMPAPQPTPAGPNTPTLGMGATNTHGPLASVSNALNPVASLPSAYAGDADSLALQAQVLRAQLWDVIRAGMGNPNVDQAQFAGLSGTDAAGGPLQWSH